MCVHLRSREHLFSWNSSFVFLKKFFFRKKKSVSHTRKKSLDKRFFFLFWEKKFCFSFEKKFFFLFFLLGKYSFQNGITRKKQLSPAPQHSRWNSRRNRAFFRVWQPCDWYVTTTVCPRLLNRIQSWNPPPLRHLIQNGHFWLHSKQNGDGNNAKLEASGNSNPQSRWWRHGGCIHCLLYRSIIV